MLSWIWTRVQQTKINADHNVCQFLSVADPDPGSGAILTPGSGMKIKDYISESLETIFLDLLDPGSGIRDETIRIRDPG